MSKGNTRLITRFPDSPYLLKSDSDPPASPQDYLEDQELRDEVLRLVRDVSESFHVEAHLALLDAGQGLSVVLAPAGVKEEVT